MYVPTYLVTGNLIAAKKVEQLTFVVGKGQLDTVKECIF